MTGRRDVDEELRARLHEAAGAHRPDRARILTRVERGMAGGGRPVHHRTTRPPLPGWARVAGATAAVAGVLAVGGYAVASALKDDAPERRSVAAASSTPSTAPGSKAPDAPVPSRPPASAAADGPLWSNGAVDPHSNEFWAQNNVTLRTAEALTALTVELRVAQTGGVTSTGAWRSLPEDDFDFAVGERDGFLVYRWTLKEGRTVPAGEWVFAGQYDHARGGRDAQADRYTATAAAGSGGLSVRGDFAARDGGS
ncbi:hypothetical protein [Streptomyces sp. M92]|uniref:hypothetical protein n=1 Tax=Streptomyces sp. M92 TaxID=2944250 RepID=UPI00234B7CE8|nr:hypothetical protein [Streptomyces sp. M92]WCN00657.1 hypothetical protein M6G08_00475 [Streptomyces sp. M92]